MMTGSKNILIMIAAFGLIALVFYFKGPSSPSSLDGGLSGPSTPSTQNDGSNGTVPPIDGLRATPSIAAAAPGPMETLDQKNLRSFRVSEEAKREFFEASHAQAHLPSELTFTPIDLGMDQAIGIYGRGQLYEMSVLAGRMNPTEQELLDYLKSTDTGIPLIDRHGLASLSPKAVTVPPIKGNGMREGKYWSGRTKDGKEFRVGLMPREDGVGSYLVMISGDGKVIDGSDDLFDGLYESFKALPEK